MPDASDNPPNGGSLDLRLSVPAQGELRAIASELAAKIAEHLGTAASDAQSVGQQVDGLAASLGTDAAHADQSISFAFRRVDDELVIEARRNSEAAEVRHPLRA